MFQRQLFSSFLRRSLASSAGLKGQQQPTKAVPSTPKYPKVDAKSLVSEELNQMVKEIHQEFDKELETDSELGKMAKYYFDGQGKAVRPVIAMTIGHAFNAHCGVPQDSEIVAKQRKVAIISEMIHAASLVHDDILDGWVFRIF